MELFMVYALHLEPWREAIVSIWQRSAAEDVDLGLDGNGGAFGDAIEVLAVVVNEEWVVTVGKAASLLVWVKAVTSSVSSFKWALQPHLEVSLYCCCGVNICGCSLNTSILCLCNESEMKLKSASVKLFKLMP
jgi:hypothetical protein